jgi:hypothetical protein
MLLYIIGIEILRTKIQNDAYIEGIKIPNINETCKTFQHADDSTHFITNTHSFQKLINQYNSFGKALGALINHNKTEILLIGNWRGNHPGLPPEYIKPHVKILGVYFGSDSKNHNYNMIIAKLKKTHPNLAIQALYTVRANTYSQNLPLQLNMA